MPDVDLEDFSSQEKDALTKLKTDVAGGERDEIFTPSELNRLKFIKGIKDKFINAEFQGSSGEIDSLPIEQLRDGKFDLGLEPDTRKLVYEDSVKITGEWEELYRKLKLKLAEDNRIRFKGKELSRENKDEHPRLQPEVWTVKVNGPLTEFGDLRVDYLRNSIDEGPIRLLYLKNTSSGDKSLAYASVWPDGQLFIERGYQPRIKDVNDYIPHSYAEGIPTVCHDPVIDRFFPLDDPYNQAENRLSDSPFKASELAKRLAQMYLD